MDKKLGEIEGFPKEVHKKLADNYSIDTVGGFVALDAVVDKEWMVNILGITEEDYNGILELAKIELTEEELELYSNPNITPGCFSKQFDDEVGFPTGYFYDEEDEIKKFIKEEFGED